MFDFINFGADRAVLLLLVIIRVSGVFLTAPVFSDTALPKLLKAGLAILLALILVPTLPNLSQFQSITSNWQLAMLVLNELLVGSIIGLMFRLLFFGVLTSGAIVGYQIGFMFANMFDSNLSNQVSLISRFWYIVAILFFFSISGHHLIIRAFTDSYQLIPVGFMNTEGPAGEMIIEYSAYIFIIAVKIAAPVMITLFLTDMALGIIAKTMPTMNVFFVGFPIKIAVGMVVMALSLPLFTFVLEKALHYFDSELSNLLYAIGRA